MTNTPKWRYIGNPKDVSPCEYKTAAADCFPCPCNDCPGRIKGECTFSDNDPLEEYRNLYERVTYTKKEQ